ncbi:MAG: hypothetical protein IPO66_07185 [Rhodanobacteraceae bacterium]|nr:hypothetical protein [Rhodanobacteraceae bacterium]
MSHHPLRPHLLTCALLTALVPAAHAGEFVYQGQLDDGGVPANGRYDLRIAAFGDEKSPQTLLAPIEFPGVEVKDGRFELRFDAPLASDREAWLEVAVRDAGASAWAGIPGRSKALAAPLIGACWSVTGDAGSNPATNFLGTTDAQPLVLRTRNVQSLRIEPSTELFGGSPNTANVIAGSSTNSVTAGVRGATIAGGGLPAGNSDPDLADEAPNRVSDHFGTVAGGYANVAGDSAGATIDAAYATVAGGALNVASGIGGAIAGGKSNVSSGAHSTVAGGRNNRASSDETAVGGGSGNLASGVNSTIAGGRTNVASGEGSVVAGGDTNSASGTFSFVGGGGSNAASGFEGIVTGGFANCAGGAVSWASGNRAKVRPGLDPGVGSACSGLTYPGFLGDQGTFIWSDTQDADFVSSGANQFLVRADGGAMFNRNTLVDPGFDDFVIGARSASSGGDADTDLRLVTRNGRSVAMFVSDGSGSLILNLPSLTAGSNRLQVNGDVGGTATLSHGGAWTNASSRTFKEGFAAIDPADVLERVLALGISRWSYIGSGEGEHVGPMAEDFHAAFGLGHSEKQIATVDADGVALAAIQGLNAKLEAENAALRERLAALERARAGQTADLAAMRQQLSEMRALLAPDVADAAR